jgi:hypothetical protein
MILPPLHAGETLHIVANKEHAAKTHFPRRVSLSNKNMMRRLSALVMPKRGDCTLLPELSSIDGLLQRDGIALEDEILQTASQLTSLSSRSVDETSIDPTSPMCWHVVLLGRTFRDTPLQDVARSLAVVLEIDQADALKKAHKAKESTTLVVGTCSDCREACEKARSLRSQGLLVQVASEMGLPSPSSSSKSRTSSLTSQKTPRTPKAPTPKAEKPVSRARRPSYADVFEVANRGVADSMKFSDNGHKSSPKAAFVAADSFSRQTSLETSSLEVALPQAQRRRSSCPSIVLDGVEALKPNCVWDDETMIDPFNRQISEPVCGSSSMASIPADFHMEFMTSEMFDGCSSGRPTTNSIESGNSAPSFAGYMRRHGKVARMEPCSTPSSDGGPHAEGSEKKQSSSRREASALVRFLVFGEVPSDLKPMRKEDESTNVSDLKPCREDVIVTTGQVRRLTSFWDDLDPDRSGDVDLVEFKNCMSQKLRESFMEISPDQVMPYWARMTPSEKAVNDFSKFVSRLRERIAGHLFGKQSTFSLEDLMKLIWLGATPADLRTTRTMFEDMCSESRRSRVKTPATLQPFQYQELCAVFRHYCDFGDLLSFDQMVISGLVDSEKAVQLRREWDHGGNGMLDMARFCEIMCPSGYRATAQSTVGSTEDDTRVVCDPVTGRWGFHSRGAHDNTC